MPSQRIIYVYILVMSLFFVSPQTVYAGFFSDYFQNKLKCENGLLGQFTSLFSTVSPASTNNVTPPEPISLKNSIEESSVNYSDYFFTDEEIVERPDLSQRKLKRRPKAELESKGTRLHISDRVRKGRYGGELREVNEDQSVALERGENWFQGYPDMVKQLFGKKTAEVLQYLRVSPGLVLDPDASEINSTLNELDQIAMNDLERAHLRFYEPQEDRVDPLVYKANFAFYGLHPKAYNSQERTHDGHYHISGILLPQGYLRLLRAQTRVILRFLVFLNKLPESQIDLPDKFFGRTPHDFAESLRKLVYVDTPTAILSISANSYFPVDIIGGHTAADSFETTLWSNLRRGLSPQSVLENLTIGLLGRHKGFDQAYQAFVDWQKEMEPDFDLSLYQDIGFEMGVDRDTLCRERLKQEVNAKMAAMRIAFERLHAQIFSSEPH